jgi:hypothetical protein
VIIQNITSGEAFNMVEADSYDKALDLAKKSGKVPNGWNIAVSDANDARIIVVCKKGTIVAGEGIIPVVSPPKPKAKKVALPEKLVGKENPEAVFMQRHRSQKYRQRLDNCCNHFSLRDVDQDP